MPRSKKIQAATVIAVFEDAGRSEAKEQVEANRERLAANLRAHQTRGAPLVLDVALPGAAYFSVAAGGLAEVLHLLGEEHVRVDRFLGASGGACSLFLILANQREQPVASGAAAPGSRCPDSEVLLRSYLQYGESEGSGSVSRSFNAFRQVFAGVSSFWESKYRELLQNESAFRVIRERAFAAVAAKPLRRQAFGTKAPRPPAKGDSADSDGPQDFEAASDNYLFHNFETREQAVQAFVATGEATVKGFFCGINVLGQAAPAIFKFWEGGQPSRQVSIPRYFCDGGHPVAPQFLPPLYGCDSGQDERENALLYYSTWFEDSSDALFCTPQSVERLFKRGVDRTVECLCCPGLVSPEPPGDSSAANKPVSDKMVVVLPGVRLADALAWIGKEKSLTGGAFVSISRHEVAEVDRA